jgi:tetratricopeptide (TPR) repeat protein
MAASPFSKPLLFVAMPFGIKVDPGGSREVDFDKLYETCVKPAAEAVDVESIRADEEVLGGIIHKPMYERLLLAEIVVADLTFANPNVFYELGVRHAAKPRSTILTFAKVGHLPFDVAPIRAIPYELDPAGALVDPGALRDALAERLELAKTSEEADSPLFQLLEDYPGIALPHEATEAFRDRALWVSELTIRAKEATRAASEEEAREALAEIEREASGVTGNELELQLTLMFSYRAIEAWGDVVRIAEDLRGPVAEAPMVREQLAMALNRRNDPGDRSRAIEILEDVVAEHGESPETLGILGRCFKSRWQEKEEAADDGVADALDEAIEAYERGFEADPRDYYPGINLLTLLVRRGRPEDIAKVEELRFVVAFAVARMGGLRASDYWARATVLELAAIAGDEERGRRALSAMRDTDPDRWMMETTANNLDLFAARPVYGGLSARWIAEVTRSLREEEG